MHLPRSRISASDPNLNSSKIGCKAWKPQIRYPGLRKDVGTLWGWRHPWAERVGLLSRMRAQELSLPRDTRVGHTATNHDNPARGQ